jgi:hypothetical protein
MMYLSVNGDRQMRVSEVHAMRVANIDQIPSMHGNGVTTWNIEASDGNEYVITRTWATGKFAAERIDWVAAGEDGEWVGTPVSIASIRNFLPERLYA